LTASQLQALDNGGSYTTGSLSLGFIETPQGSLGGTAIQSAAVGFGYFYQLPGLELPILGLPTVTAPQPCQVSTIDSFSVTATPTPTTPITTLDAGTLTVAGPPGSGIASQNMTNNGSNVYTVSIGGSGGNGTASASPSFAAGTYTVNGSGGKDIAKFTATATASGSFSITGGLPATITRSLGLTLGWTGADPSASILITGTSISVTGAAITSTTFSCTISAGGGSFTVPASILNQLVASTGLLEVAVTSPPVPFTAPLTAGGSTVSAGFSLSLTLAGNATFK
jgi:hypothetical protein